MTWPTTPITTANVDQGADNPSLARVQIKESFDQINAITSEFGNVGITSAANLQLIQYNGTDSQWQNQYPTFTRYREQVVTASNANIDFDAGSVQRLTMTSNVAFDFQNFPDGGTVTVIVKRTGTAYSASWPANTVFAFGANSLGSGASTKDVVVVSYDGADTEYLVSISADFV